MMFTFDDQRSVLGRLRASGLREPFTFRRDPRLGKTGLGGGIGIRPSPLGADDYASNQLTWGRHSLYELEIDAALLLQIFGASASSGSAQVSHTRIEPLVAPLNTYLQRYDIDSVCRISSFFGQIAVECAGLTQLEERLIYTTTNALQKAYGERIPERDRPSYLHNAQRLSNLVYADRNGNGDESSGDGWRYRGRGLMHLTGKDNYSKFAAACGRDVVESPDLLKEPLLAVWSACWYWSFRKLNQVADTGDLRKLTLRVNGGYNGLDKRLEMTDWARRCIHAHRSIKWP